MKVYIGMQYGDKVMGTSDRASFIVHIAIPILNHKLPDLREEKNGNECMRKFMSKFHEPVKVMPHTRNNHRDQE